ASWRPLVAGTDGVVHDVVAGPADTHHVAGNFRSFVAQPANGVGTIRTASFWYAPPFTSSQRAWRRIARRGDGALFLTAEKFTSQRTIHMLQGSVLTQLGEAAGEACLAIDDLGELIVGAIEVDSAFPLPTPLARRSNATGAWWPVDVGLTGRVTALAVLADGRLAVGGDNLASTTGPLGSLAVYDGAGWDDLLGGVDAPPTDLAALPGGGLVAVGPFTTAGGLTVNGIASWDGSGWQAHGTGFAVPTAAPRTVAVLPTAELLVGGTFASAGGTPAANLARWDGASWHAVGSGTDGPVRRIDASTGGDVVLCGDFLSFDGATAAGVAAMTPSCPATTAPQLAACGAGVPPQVEVDGLPWRNGTARLSAAPFVGPSFAVGVFGLQPAAIPLTSLGLPSQAQCMLSVQPDLLLLAAPQQGVAHFALAIPGQPAVIGTTLYHQTVGFSFATPAAFTTSTSRRLRLVVGSLW
ncbi:MAG: hypothetical protein KAI24_10970, partial [Planctomycetes bacterium]|nr:hypothetical protein [Planctomycetota bacterium]